jgi:hypothetical protein
MGSTHLPPGTLGITLSDVGPQRPEAIVVVSGSRIFALRRDSEAVIVDMFSKFDDRPSFYWTDSFTKSQGPSSPR